MDHSKDDSCQSSEIYQNLIAFTMIILGVLSVYIIEKFSEHKEWKNMGLLEKN